MSSSELTRISCEHVPVGTFTCPTSERCCSIFDDYVAERFAGTLPAELSDVPSVIRGTDRWCCPGTRFCSATAGLCTVTNERVEPVEEDSTQLQQLIIISASIVAFFLIVAIITFVCVRRRSRKQDKVFAREHERRARREAEETSGFGPAGSAADIEMQRLHRELASLRRGNAEPEAGGDTDAVPRPGAATPHHSPPPLQSASAQQAHANAVAVVMSGAIAPMKEDAIELDIPVDEARSGVSAPASPAAAQEAGPQLPAAPVSPALLAKNASFRQTSPSPPSSSP